MRSTTLSVLKLFVLFAVLNGARSTSQWKSRGVAASARLSEASLAEQSPANEALAWLPADTETVTAANGPFLLPEMGREDNEETKFESEKDIAELFRGLSMGLLELQNGMFGTYFKGAKVEFAIEGARVFRAPSGLGGGPYDGADILIFSSDMTAAASSFMKEARKTALRMEKIDGQTIAVFQEKMEDDTWTSYVAFPKPNLAVAATDREYLREVLARIGGKSGPRALPDGIPEWKYVDKHATFWAVRHYTRGGASTDPTSPFGGKKTANIADDKAIGLTVVLEERAVREVRLTYLGGKDALAEIYSEVEREPGAKELGAKYREIEPGVFEGRYHLNKDESVSIFTFVLLALLGHAVYL